MFFSKPMRNTCVAVMSVILTNIPAQVLAKQKLDSVVKGQMIPTAVAVEEMNRAEAEARIQGFLANADLRKALQEQGLSTEEINQRLASLSDSEMKQLAGQMEQARYGGDVLVAILLVVLIIFLIRRI